MTCQRALSEVDLTQEGESVLGEEADKSPLCVASASAEVDLTQEGESVLGEEADSPMRPMLPDAPLPFGFSVRRMV